MKLSIYLAKAVLCSGLLFFAFDSASAQCRSAQQAPDPALPDLDCAAPPNTFDVQPFFSANASPEAKALAGPVFDAWAWASFAALNWPAEVSAAIASPTGFIRGVPSQRRSFKQARPDDVLVWETFKEKRELFHPLDGTVLPTNATWQAVTFDQTQVPSQLGGAIQACDGVDPKALDRGHHRIISQRFKQPTAGGSQTLDETVEVASQALEPTTDLCAGYSASTNPTLDYCQNNLFPDQPPRVVDARIPVGPRVWKGNPGPGAAGDSSRPIYFEVKVNYDFWQYILDNDFQDDSVAGPAALSADVDKHPKLPFRTSAAKGPGRSQEAVYAYDAQAVAGSYADLDNPNVLPGVGSIQTKAAWLRLTPREAASGEYHTTEAVFFATDDQDPGKVCYKIDTFGLLALHIIQRVHARPFDRRNPNLFAHGGTFIFATWEHLSLSRQPSGFFYANYVAFPGPLGVEGKYPFTPDQTPFPNFVEASGGALPVVRQQAYPLPTTQAVTAAVHAQLPQRSVWRNYQLIGTQFLAADSEQESMQYNQPHFLANLVVETNLGLQAFHGLPPGVTVTPYYTEKVNIEGTSVVFKRDTANVIFNRSLKAPVNMGGCMGCHGVAQLKGFNFSFVFAGGQLGAGLDTPSDFEVAGAITDTGAGGGEQP